MLAVQGSRALTIFRAHRQVASSVVAQRSSSTGMVSSFTENVEVHQYVSAAANNNNLTNMFRLPNDVRERNAIYRNEENRSMSGVDARVRHVSKYTAIYVQHNALSFYTLLK